MKNKNLSSVEKKLLEIKDLENLSPQALKLLSTPQKINRATLSIGSQKIPAWRIMFNNALGPGKGGIRFHPAVSEKEIQSLAFLMAIKNALTGLPYGGAKGGIKFNPKNTSLKQQEVISRKYIDAFYKELGQDKDIPAPDVYTNPQIMAWMLDEFEKKVGHHEPGMITGKPLELQGCCLRYNATAKGGFIITQALIKKFKLTKKKITVALQGFGNAGAYLAQMLNQAGLKIIAVSDSQGGIYDKNGLDIEAVLKIKQTHKSVQDYTPAKQISNSELLELPSDLLILAALEDQITETNARNIKAHYIIEIANGPITYEADKFLAENKVIIIPDVLANSGGVIASYFEWAQNRTGNILDKHYLEKLLQEKMTTAWKEITTLAKQDQRSLDLRTSAYLLAIRKILTAEKLRGHLH